MHGYMRHLIGPYGPKGIPYTPSRKLLDLLEYIKLWERLLEERERAEEMQAIREGRWTTWVPSWKRG